MSTISWTPSNATLRIMAIAKEEHTEISEKTFQEIDAIFELDDPCEVIPGEEPRTPCAAGPTENDNLETIKEVLKITKQAASVGKMVFKQLGPFLGPVGSVASVLIQLIEVVEPKKEDPVMLELKEVEHQIHKLSERIDGQFDDLKAFLSESEFYTRYALATRMLFKYMADVMGDPCQRTRDEFAAEYKNTNPKRLVYEMLSMLEMDKTNPLKWAMNADQLKTTDTFEKWTATLDSILTQALFLEKFASGLLFNNNDSEVDRIIKEIGRFMELTKVWDQYYRTNSLFWKDDLRRVVEGIQEDNSLEGHEKKADAIWELMMKIHTDDQFFLVVTGDHIIRWELSNESKAFWSSRNGCNVIVYCTKPCDWPSADWYHGLPKLANTRFNYGKGFMFDHWQLVRWWCVEKRIVKWSAEYKPNEMFLVIAQTRSCIAVRHTTRGNCGSLGPGGFTFDVRLNLTDGFSHSTQDIFFLVGAW